MLMKTSSALLMLVTLLAPSKVFGAQASDTAFAIGNAHVNTFPAPFEFYASGNGQDPGEFPQFAEYGVAGFNFSAADFGGAVTDISSLTLTLTHDTRSFSDGSSVRFYYSSDDFAGGYSGLFFDGSGANDPDGIDPNDFSSLVDLGTFPYSQPAAGTVENFSLDLSSIEASLISEINSGSNFQIVIASPDLNSDITFSGIGSSRAPGDPQLTINASVVPEPGSVALILSGAFASLAFLRQR